MQITYFKPKKQGVYPLNNGYDFCAESETAEKSGLLSALAKKLEPMLLFLFPAIRKEKKAK